MDETDETMEEVGHRERVGMAWEEYLQQAWETYEKVRSQAWDEYLEKTRPDREVYEAIKKEALDTYHRIEMAVHKLPFDERFQ